MHGSPSIASASRRFRLFHHWSILGAGLMLATAHVETLGAVSPVPVSLRGTIAQDIGKTRVSILYSRPNANGRKIFGALVPYGAVWRTGANEATTIAFNTNVSLAGQHVPAGEYALFTIPGEDTWTIILNTVPKQFGAFSHDPSRDLVRVSVPADATPAHVETFEIAFTHVADNAARIILSWADTAVAVPISVTEASNDAQIEAEIQRDIIQGSDATWANYGEAARFYARKNKNLETAVTWFDRCNELNPAAWWLFYEKARVLAQLGRSQEATVATEAGIEAAKAAGHQHGQDMGRDLLDELAGTK